MFLLLSECVTHLEAEGELHTANAATYGMAIGFGGAKDPKVKRYMRSLIRTAFPEQ